MNILKTITDKLKGYITEASFEGANIVLYTDNQKFFQEGASQIKAIENYISFKYYYFVLKKLIN
mgnify:CR=1 FL=1